MMNNAFFFFFFFSNDFFSSQFPEACSQSKIVTFQTPSESFTSLILSENLSPQLHRRGRRRNTVLQSKKPSSGTPSSSSVQDQKDQTEEESAEVYKEAELTPLQRELLQQFIFLRNDVLTADPTLPLRRFEALHALWLQIVKIK